MFSILAALAMLTSCAQMRMFTEAYKAMPDDNIIEESGEWIVEGGVEVLTGQKIHLDITGDSPE